MFLAFYPLPLSFLSPLSTSFLECNSFPVPSSTSPSNSFVSLVLASFPDDSEEKPPPPYGPNP